MKTLVTRATGYRVRALALAEENTTLLKRSWAGRPHCHMQDAMKKIGRWIREHN